MTFSNKINITLIRYPFLNQLFIFTISLSFYLQIPQHFQNYNQYELDYHMILVLMRLH